jgi:hypothetical protein
MSKHIRVLVLLGALLFSMASFSVASAQTGTCDTTGTVNGSATPVAGVVGDTIIFTGTGFAPNESVSFWFTLPNGAVLGTAQPIPGGVNPDGTVGPLPLTIPTSFAQFPGRWAITFQGTPSNHMAIIYFCVGFRQLAATPTSPPAPTATSAPATATAVPPTVPAATATGVLPTEVPTVQPAATTVAEPTATTPAVEPTAAVEPTTTPGTTPGMPRTGENDATLSIMIAFAVVSLSLLGMGWAIRHRNLGLTR